MVTIKLYVLDSSQDQIEDQGICQHYLLPIQLSIILQVNWRYELVQQVALKFEHDGALEGQFRCGPKIPWVKSICVVHSGF